MQDWYWAADLDAGGQFSSINLRTETDAAGEQSSVVKLKHPVGIGFTVRAGYTFRDAVLFLGIGCAYGQWRLRVSNRSNQPAYGVDPHSEVRFSKSKIVFKPGIGVIIKLAKCWVVVLEYNFLCGPNLSRETTSSDLIDWKHSTKVRQHSVQLDFNYRFKS